MTLYIRFQETVAIISFDGKMSPEQDDEAPSVISLFPSDAMLC
jgi:hypothetical protein